MTGQRQTWAAAERLRDRLSTRDWAIVHSLESGRVLTGQQLSRVHFFELSPRTQDRIRRRVLARLTDWQVLARLDRVIGGVRAGSTGWVYSLGVTGHRLLQLEANQRGGGRLRPPWTPGSLFLHHSLAVAEIYVQLTETSRTGPVTLSHFQTEPGCWWPDGLGGFLKPDAHLVLSTTDFDELVWLEVDRGTESLPTIRRKLAAYSDFVRRGQLGPGAVVPYVVLSTTTTERAARIRALVGDTAPAANIFRICTDEHVITEIFGLTADQEEPP